MDDSNEQKPLGPDDSSLETPPSGPAGMSEGSQAQPAANPSVPTPEQPVPKKKLAGWKLWVLIAAGALLLLGGGAFAYLGYYLPNQPENVIGKAMQNFLLAESFSFTSESEFSQSEAGNGFSLDTQGAVDTSTGALSAFWLDGQVKYSSAVIEAKLRGQSQKLYFNLSGLMDSSSLLSGLVGGEGGDSLGLAAGISQLLSSIEDTWFVLDTADLVPIENGPDIPDSDRQKVLDIVSRYELFTVLQEEDNREINGRQARGFVIDLNPQEIETALREIAAADYEVLEFDDSLLEDINTSVGETDEQPDYNLAVWVYDNDKTLAALDVEGGDDKGSYSLSLTFDSYNQAVEVDIPEETTPAEELLGSLFAF